VNLPSARLIAALTSTALVGCTGPDRQVTAPPAVVTEAILYVAVGASETVGIGTEEPLREAWPQVLFRIGFPRTTTMINLGIPGATVSTALQAELPHALGLEPDVVTVWLNVNDLLSGVSPEAYEEELGSLVGRLRRGGATTVLVANTPPLDRLPMFLECRPFAPQPGGGCDRGRRLPKKVLDAAVDSYNEAIERVVDRHGAVLVDLHSVVVAARDSGTEMTLYAADGFHPSVAGHRLAAEVFARAYAASNA
jgi:acyl-CoA thioesterase-1